MRTFIYLFIATLLVACNKEDYDMNEFHKMYGDASMDVGAMIDKISNYQIYFGHQSIGNNILSGISQWEQETGSSLNIIQTRDFENIKGESFVHYMVGNNGDPQSKISDFSSVMKSIPEEVKAYSFFKLCYVDITEDSDVEGIFLSFKEEIVRLMEELPADVRLILFTVPVTGIQKGWKAFAKKILNRPPWGALQNVNRHRFNELLKEEFSGILPIFDLAGVETTLPDGTLQTFKYEGKEYPCMPDFYTSDLGHLNDYGSKLVAYNLLAYLAQELE
jgi:hypothetical protein